MSGENNARTVWKETSLPLKVLSSFSHRMPAPEISFRVEVPTWGKSEQQTPCISYLFNPHLHKEDVFANEE